MVLQIVLGSLAFYMAGFLGVGRTIFQGLQRHCRARHLDMSAKTCHAWAALGGAFIWPLMLCLMFIMAESLPKLRPAPRKQRRSVATQREVERLERELGMK